MIGCENKNNTPLRYWISEHCSHATLYKTVRQCHEFRNAICILRRLTIEVPAPATGDYMLTGYFTKARDYGIFQVLSHGQKVGAAVNAYFPSVAPTGPIRLGRIHLKAGNNPLVIRMLGKDRRSLNYFFGLNALVLRPVR